MINVSIIIKAYNEEKYIAKCIESSLKALKKVGGKNEIILVDSLSEDKTVEIAKKYPIRIVQLRKGWQKSATVAEQIGYIFSKGKFIYAFDGDMTVDKNFLKKSLPYLYDEKIAGVNGIMSNIGINKRVIEIAEKQNKKLLKKKINEVQILTGDALYKREAIEKFKYLFNPWLRADGEAYFGYHLRKIGYKLLKLSIPSTTHYGYNLTPFKFLFKKWRTGYLQGKGQVLRYNLKTGLFWQHIKRLWIYMAILIWWFIGTTSLLLLPISNLFLIYYLILTSVLLIGILIKKMNIYSFVYSLVSWNLTTLSIIIGFFKFPKHPRIYPTNAKIIK